MEGTAHEPSGFVRSETINELSASLCRAQAQFEAVAKDANNPFFKSHYAPLPHVVKAATPILAAEGLAVWQGPDCDEHGDLLWTVILHSSGQYLGSAMRMRPVKNDPQAQGSAITYARRYAYMAALGLVADEDDDGNAASEHKPAGRQQSRGKGNTRTRGSNGASKPQDAPQPTDPPATTEALNEIRTRYQASGLTSEKFTGMLDELGAPAGTTVGTRVAGLSQPQADWLLAALRQAAPAEAAEASA